MIPVVTDATVTESTSLGAYRVLSMRAREVATGARPGQFLNVAVGGGTLLRRPFSVYRTDRALGTVSIAFDPIGRGTEWLAARAPGDELNIVGPLGHGFEVGEPGGADLLVGGGYGSAALAFLAQELAERGRVVHAVLGARTAGRVFRDETLRRWCASITVTTDDGSAGRAGVVTDAMPEACKEHGVTAVYACGPNRMLRAVGEAALAIGVPAQLAVEEFMACGIGVCWTCVLPVLTDGSIAHRRTCTEGPVFRASEVAWA